MRWSTMVPRTLPDRSFASRTGEASTDTLMPKRSLPRRCSRGHCRPRIRCRRGRCHSLRTGSTRVRDTRPPYPDAGNGPAGATVPDGDATGCPSVHDARRAVAPTLVALECWGGRITDPDPGRPIVRTVVGTRETGSEKPVGDASMGVRAARVRVQNRPGTVQDEDPDGGTNAP